MTGKDDEKVSAQRLLHPLSNTLVKFMSRDYQIHLKHLQRIHRPQNSDQDTVDSSNSDQDTVVSLTSDQVTVHSPKYLDTINNQIRKPWSQINDKFYEEDSSDEEEQEDDSNQAND